MDQAEKNTKTATVDTRQSKYIRLLLALVIVVGIVLAVVFLPVKEWLVKSLEWTRGQGIWGAVIVVLFYILACVFFLPGSVITLGTGFVFKLLLGTVIVSIGSTLGACTAFLLGRTIARDWIAAKARANEKFAAIDEAVGREGFKIVLLTRLSPLFPFNFLNYALGLTKVSFGKYALASWIGMLPGTIMYVYIGASLGTLAEAAAERETSVGEKIFYSVGLAIAIVVVVVVTRVARKALKEAVQEKD